MVRTALVQTTDVILKTYRLMGKERTLGLFVGSPGDWDTHHSTAGSVLA